MTKTLGERFGQNIKKLRLENKLTQRETSLKCNTSQQSYSKYELGLVSPTLNFVEKVAKFYNVEASDLLR